MDILKKPLHARFSKKKQFLFFAIPLLLATLFQWLFFDHGLGINYPLFLMSLFIGYLSLFWERIEKKSLAGWVTMASSILLSFVFLIFKSKVIIALNFLLIPVLALSSGILLTGWSQSPWFDLSFVWEFFPRMLVKLLEQLPTPIRSFANLLQFKKSHSSPVYKQILKAIIIASPLLFIILALLASADPVFNQLLLDFTSVIQIDIADELIGRIIITLIAFWGLAAFTWMIASEKNTSADKTTEFKSSILPVTTITILSLVNIIYFVFVIVQFAYFFHGADLSFLENMTFAEYARRGFGELIAITLINLSLILGFSVFTTKKSNETTKTRQILSSFLILVTTIILYSSHLRLSLYEQAYGFTYTRFFVHAFMLFLGICLISAVLKIWKQEFSFLKPVLVIGLTGWIILSFVNVDKLITLKNIERFHANERIDLSYLTNNLSEDAIPTILDFSQKQNYKLMVLDLDLYDLIKICAEPEACYPIVSYTPEEKLPWQEFNLSKKWVNDFAKAQIAESLKE